VDVIEAISSRRSLGKWSEAAPSQDLIEAMLEAAINAPNHHDSQPWRFFVLRDEAREHFGDALVDALLRRNPDLPVDKAQVLAAAERAKPLRAPVLIVVACKHSTNPKIVPSEDYAACSAAIQNLLLAAHGLGLTAQWKTGEAITDSQVKRHFGLAKEDQIVGIVYVGYAADEAMQTAKIRSRSYEAVTSWLN
jgi:nitroreductase